MAKKKRKPQHIRQQPSSSTKRQLSHWQRQQRTQRIIRIAAIIFFICVLGYVGYGYYDNEVKPFKQPVLRVDDTVFDMGYYMKVLDLYSRGQESVVVSLIADMVLDSIEQQELTVREAAGLGITVSDEEIDSKLDEVGLTDDKVHKKVIGAELVTDRLMADYFDPKIPVACEQVQVQAMFLESETVAEEVASKLEAGDDFAALAKEFSTEAQTNESGGDLGWLPKGFSDVLLGGLGGSLLSEIMFEMEPEMLSEPIYDESVTKEVGYWLIEVLDAAEQFPSLLINIVQSYR